MAADQLEPAESGNDGEIPMIFTGLRRFDRQTVIRQTSFYISGMIDQASYYNELFYALRTACETDLIYLHLNTTGGDFDTGLQIINNMQASAAHVVTVLEARAYSMGAFIFLAGDELVVHDNCQLLFHSYSGSLTGKGNEQQAQAVAIANWFGKFMARICQPFLHTREINAILKGSDLWMDSDEIRRRMLRLLRSNAPAAPARRQAATVPHAVLANGESGN
ncbi:Clp protease ClpP [Duganella sp. FT92W]|uniref:Clp protease ClpP n=1 Tax=Pseudoduganella rivuli TaxID=2666085 RepID=A0A7X2IQ39_9BURK|nr:ATP-dependent Clp protease proteolytic subunit [Pseudoduganella rivuli]MRV73909.1 Clp protease ClpP [Pseudoduganella rivuli]